MLQRTGTLMRKKLQGRLHNYIFLLVSKWLKPVLHRYSESVEAQHFHTSAKLNKGWSVVKFILGGESRTYPLSFVLPQDWKKCSFT